jgi:hypothetical protein
MVFLVHIEFPAQVYEITPFKNEVCLLYLIGVFLKGVKEVLRKKQKPNLRNAAQRYRVKDAKVVMKIACLWAHFRPQFLKRMSADEFQQCEGMFFRGSFEREFTDKVNAEKEELCFDDFRFLSMFKSSCPSVHGAVSNEATEEQTAQKQADDAQLKLIKSLLQKDVEHWEKHLSKLKDHEDSQRYSKRVHDRTQRHKIESATVKLQEIYYPVRAFKGSEGLAVWVPSCLHAWSETALIQLSETYLISVDLSKLGNSFKKALPDVLRVIADAAAHNPKQVAAIMVAPLIGARGAGADADAAGQAHDDCEVEIKKPIHKLMSRRITL